MTNCEQGIFAVSFYLLRLLINYAHLAVTHTIGLEGFTPPILEFEVQPGLCISEYSLMRQTMTLRMDLLTSAVVSIRLLLSSFAYYK